MMLEQIQNQLECIYGIALPQRVVNYLVNKKEALNFLKLPQDSKIPHELFLVKNNGEKTVEIALFLDSRLITNLKKNDPFVSLNANNLSDFCILIEGVSHFVYFLWKTYQDRPITQLELELQAEIDKFLMLLFYLRSDHNHAIPQQLFDALFDDFKLVDKLSIESKNRYLTASSLASQYCHRLQLQMKRPKQLNRVLEEIRNFYNFSQEQKINFITH